VSGEGKSEQAGEWNAKRAQEPRLARTRRRPRRPRRVDPGVQLDLEGLLPAAGRTGLVMPAHASWLHSYVGTAEFGEREFQVSSELPSGRS